MKYDAERTRFLESIGYHMIRYWNSHTFESEDAIAQYILSLVRPHPQPLPSLGEGSSGA